jgi:hypothetical protein
VTASDEKLIVKSVVHMLPGSALGHDRGEAFEKFTQPATAHDLFAILALIFRESTCLNRKIQKRVRHFDGHESNATCDARSIPLYALRP